MRWSENPFIIADNQSSITATIIKNLNHPLPWFGVFSLIVVFCTAQSYQSKQAAFDAKTTALLAEQHFKDLSASIDTRLKQSDEYIEKLRFEMASHGLIPPEKTK